MLAVVLCFSGTVVGQEAPPQHLTPGALQPQLQPSRPSLPDPNAPTFRVPPVFERPLGVDEGERVFVKGFVLRGVTDDAGAGIDAREVEERVQRRFQELQDLLESLRVERQNQADVDADGFTPEEKQRILEFIQRVISSLDADRQVQAYEAFVDQLRLQRLERDQGLTIGQLQLVADEVTKYYRELGYILARAVIPAQEVVDGIVTIQVLEGRLARVVPEGHRRYDTDTLVSPFEDSIGKLVTVERMENALLTLQSFPGMSVSGVFRPGASVGTTEMVLNVQNEKPYNFTVRGDNHGSKFTGEARLLTDFTWNAPTGSGDLLNVTVLKTFEPDAALFGALRYERPFADPSFRWGVETGRNEFEAFNPQTGDPLEASGVSQNSKLYLQHYFKRSRTESNYMRLDLSRKRSDSKDPASEVILSRDDLTVLGVEFGGDTIEAATNTITSLYFRVDRGFDSVLGVPNEDDVAAQNLRYAYSRDGTDVRFLKYSFSYTALKALTPTQTLLMRAGGNYSNDALASVEQFAMGGPSSVRGAPVSAALRDKGVFGSLEWSIRAPGFADKPAWGGQPWGRVFGVSFFTDHARGWHNRGDQTEDFTNERLYLGSYGMGFDVTLPGKVSLKAMWSRLLGGTKGPQEEEDTTGIKETSQFWVEISRGF